MSTIQDEIKQAADRAAAQFSEDLVRIFQKFFIGNLAGAMSSALPKPEPVPEAPKVPQEAPSSPDPGSYATSSKVRPYSFKDLDEIRRNADRAFDLLRKKPHGLRIGQIADQLGLDKRDVKAALDYAREKEKVTLQGEKMLAKYFAVDKIYGGLLASK